MNSDEQQNSLCAGDRLLTVKEVAAWLRTSEQSVYRRLREGKLAGSKIGGQWRIPQRAVVQLLEDSMVIR